MLDFHTLVSRLTFPNANVVVIGGTQSIGAGIAIRFAELGASVLIIGRNETNGNKMVEKLKNTSSNNGWDREKVRFGFARRDLSSVEEIKGAAQDIAGWAGNDGVQYLFQSQGEPLPQRP
jgi:NAD(P)-dependent dehydrogenase (short-subunit alcohol dehydrogenase family)